jgi:hypothetical protein
MVWWKFVRLAATVLLCSIAGIVAYLDRTQIPLMASSLPSAPLSAVVAGPSGQGLPNDSWTSTSNLMFRVAMDGSSSERTVVPEFEILPESTAFTGIPNSAGSLVQLPAHGHVVVRLPIVGLRMGHRYHWHVRARSFDGTTSPWIGGGVFGVSITPPTAPSLLAANVPAGILTNLRTISLHWNSSNDRTGIAYYEWANSKDTNTTPTWHQTTDRALHLHSLGNGTWQIFVRAVNGAGIPSAPLHWSIRIDRTPPHVDGLTASSHDLTTESKPSHLRFNLSKPATALLNIYRTGEVTPSAQLDLGQRSAGLQDVSWDGKGASGKFLSTGKYRLSLVTTDALGNSDTQDLSGFTLDTRRIVVSLTKQDLTAYDGSTVLLHTLITSGGPNTQTPVGTFHMLAKYTPYVMRSPWPKSSPLWYADSPVTYALLFQVGGYFLHDAPWRSVFGPGSNVVDGTPGGNTTGTHGCVNVPFAAETWLYNWSQIGTTVQILP